MRSWPVWRRTFIQLHGHETPARVQEVKSRTGAGLIKVAAVSTSLEVAAAGRDYDTFADHLMFETKPPEGADRPGGNGLTFDWDILQGLRLTRPWFLAGGLDPWNVGEAIKPVGDKDGGRFFWRGARRGAKGPRLDYGFPGRREASLSPPLNAPLKPNDYSAYPDAEGRFGDYGGRYVPETLMPLVLELNGAYEAAKADPSFQGELDGYLKHYVGRPSPMYFAERLTAHYGGAKIYFKRDELNHTGAHKINNCMGQILLAQRMGRTRIIAETGAGQHGVATATVCARFGLCPA